MGYFSNGSEGIDYEDEYCSRCVHGDGHSAGSCAIFAAHSIHNYKECNNKKSILHLLIPRSEDGLANEQCTMFKEGRGTDPEAMTILCGYCKTDQMMTKHEEWCKAQ